MTTTEVRPAPTSLIQAKIDAVVGKLQPDTHVAFVAVVDRVGGRMAVIVRPKSKTWKNWSFGGFIDKEYTGNFTAGAEIRAEF